MLVLKVILSLAHALLWYSLLMFSISFLVSHWQDYHHMFFAVFLSMLTFYSTPHQTGNVIPSISVCLVMLTYRKAYVLKINIRWLISNDSKRILLMIILSGQLIKHHISYFRHIICTDKSLAQNIHELMLPYRLVKCHSMSLINVWTLTLFSNLDSLKWFLGNCFVVW